MNKTLKILMLEDSEEDIHLIERELKVGGLVFNSFAVNERSEFHNSLYKVKPDVILADHSLPGFNSIEAFNIYQQFRSETKTVIPFILITGSVSEEFAVQRIKAGVDDYILKDRLKRLPASIQSALERAKVERERLKFLDKIISNESMMREAEQLAHFGSWQVDLVTREHKWSDETYRIFGYEPGGLPVNDQTFLNHIHPEDRPTIQKIIDEVAIHHNSYPCEFRIIDKVGNVKHILSNILVKRNHEQCPVQLSGFNLDITRQRKQTEALALQNKRLIEIAWIQSHEVRAPLARLMGLVNLMVCQQTDTCCMKDLMKPILASAHELDNVIRRIVRKTETIDHTTNDLGGNHY